MYCKSKETYLFIQRHLIKTINSQTETFKRHPYILTYQAIIK